MHFGVHCATAWRLIFLFDIKIGATILSIDGSMINFNTAVEAQLQHGQCLHRSCLIGQVLLILIIEIIVAQHMINAVHERIYLKCGVSVPIDEPSQVLLVSIVHLFQC